MNTDTPRTDAQATGNSDPQQDEYEDLLYFTRTLERELTAARAELNAVTEQREGLRSGIDYASDQLHKVTEQRDTTRKLYDVACETAAKMHAAAVGEIKGPHIDPVQDILDLRRERDRLAKALERCLDNSWDGPMPDYARQSATEALQSLTTNDKSDGTDASQKNL